MKRLLLEGPAVEPVLLAEMKAHLRLDTDDEDDLLGALIVAARVAVEAEIRRVLVEQSWRAILDAWPAGGRLVLPIVPVISVDAVRTIDAAGAATVLDAEDYEFEAADFSLALDRVSGAERYEIDFTAGYGSSGVDVPQPLRLAIRMLVTHWFEQRSAATFDDDAADTPLGYRALVAPFRKMTLC
jgi:uncharacterized phiE125 gp8 family phage protein